MHGLPSEECHVRQVTRKIWHSHAIANLLETPLGRLTCLFLATKTENHPISIDTFSSKTKSTPADILSLEFLVSQSLRFEYKVHHAHLAAYGLSLDLQVRPKSLGPTLHFAYVLYRACLNSLPRFLQNSAKLPTPSLSSTSNPLATVLSNSSTLPLKLPSHASD